MMPFLANSNPAARVRLWPLFPRARQDRWQAQDNIPDQPNHKQRAHANGCPDGGPKLLRGVLCRSDHFGCTLCRQYHPRQHEQVERNQRPFEDEAEKSPARFAQRVAAMGAVKCLVRDIVAATGACGFHG